MGVTRHIGVESVKPPTTITPSRPRFTHCMWDLFLDFLSGPDLLESHLLDTPVTPLPYVRMHLQGAPSSRRTPPLRLLIPRSSGPSFTSRAPT